MTTPEIQKLEMQTWGKPVIQLLKHCKTLNSEKPATMIIRHSERASINRPDEMDVAGLTEVGREAARGFGQLLPNKRYIRVYHSPVERCKETAECIVEGARSREISADICGEISLLGRPRGNWGSLSGILIRDWPHSVNYWLCGRYPEEIIEPSITFAKRASVELDATLEAEPRTLVLHVTHDMPILAMLFHWFGVVPSFDNSGFLGGFIYQRTADRVSLILKDSYREVDLPYWWGASQGKNEFKAYESMTHKS